MIGALFLIEPRHLWTSTTGNESSLYTAGRQQSLVVYFPSIVVRHCTALVTLLQLRWLCFTVYRDDPTNDSCMSIASV